MSSLVVPYLQRRLLWIGFYLTCIKTVPELEHTESLLFKYSTKARGEVQSTEEIFGLNVPKVLKLVTITVLTYRQLKSCALARKGLIVTIFLGKAMGIEKHIKDIKSLSFSY